MKQGGFNPSPFASKCGDDDGVPLNDQKDVRRANPPPTQFACTVDEEGTSPTFC